MANKRMAKQPITSFFDMGRLMPVDFIFLLLRVINYPGEPMSTIPFKDLAKLRLRNLSVENCMKFLIDISDEVGVEIMPDDDRIERAEIKIPPKLVKVIQQNIDSYLDRFVSEELESFGENYFNAQKQKRYFIELIQKKLDSGITKKLLIGDSEVENGYRFFEGLLLLEREKYLKIANIYNYQNPNEKDYYRIAVSVEKKRIQSVIFDDETGAEIRRPFCVEENGIGYLKFSKTGKRMRIGTIKARPYRMVRMLSKEFGVAMNINVVVESLLGKKDAGDRYLSAGKRIQKIINTKKELQKVPGISEKLDVCIDKERKTVWLKLKDAKE